jgi:hypothetical protein
VERPAVDVFGDALDPMRFHEWQPRVVSARLQGNGTPEIGEGA